MTDISEGDDTLTQRLRAGEVQALAELFAMHQARLWRMVNFRLDRRLLGRVDPDDVLQDGYLAAAQRIQHYAAVTAMSPFVWLRLIVSQTLVDVHRHHLGAQLRDAGREVAIQAGGGEQTTSASLAIHLADSLTSPSQAAQRAEAIVQVEKAIADMDPIDQEVLALRHFEELTNGEVAEVLGIQRKAASIRYFRAIRRLKTIMAGVPGFLDDAGDGEEPEHG